MKNPITKGKSVTFDPSGNTKKTYQKKLTKKYHALDKYIIFCFVCIIIYTMVHTFIFYKLGIEAQTLDTLFYSVFGGEVLVCALLKRLKLKQEHELVLKKDTNNEINNETYEEE